MRNRRDTGAGVVLGIVLVVVVVILLMLPLRGPTKRSAPPFNAARSTAADIFDSESFKRLRDGDRKP